MDEKLIESIKCVADLVLNATVEHDIEEHGSIKNASAILESIEAISRVGKELIISQGSTDFQEIIKSVDTLSYCIYKKYKDYSQIPIGEFSILKKLNRSYNENIHSDFIASLLNENLGEELLKRILLAAGWTDIAEKGVEKIKSVQRECSLESLNYKLKKGKMGARRIDIFVLFDNVAFILENKIWTHESANQTTDYYEAVKNRDHTEEVIGILLSPYRDIPLSREFRPLTYFELFDVLKELSSQYDNKLLNLYRDELKETILRPVIINSKNSKKYFNKRSI